MNAPLRPVSAGRRVRTPLVAFPVAFALLLLALGIDRRSPERGNRLYRSGEIEAAVDVYRATPPRDGARAAYNLGTALLATEPTEADSLLALATFDADPTVRRVAHYNRLLAGLAHVRPTLSADSAEVILRGAVENGRSSVRLDPTDADARWNLALAIRMLDSVTIVVRDARGEEDSGADETRIDLDALTRSGEGVGESGLEPDEPRTGESAGERQAASVGAREAWATVDPGPMSLEDAMGVLGTIDDDPERLVRGILWSRRPGVAWWLSEPFPGGDW